ncbi:MAG: LapA family protein [Parvularcula sp.]|jgi:heme A synthase|nr:LapA family protein [Parvularcula sp.]
MARFLSTVFLAALAPLLVAFLVANRRDVLVSFDPLSLDDPALAFEVPLWVGMTGTMALGILLGAIGMWISTSRLRQRSAARKLEIAKLERDLQHARSRAAGPSSSPTERPDMKRLAAPTA